MVDLNAREKKRGEEGGRIDSRSEGYVCLFFRSRRNSKVESMARTREDFGRQREIELIPN